MNFQMFKLDLEKADGPEMKLPKSLSVWITRNWKILKEMGIPDHLTCLLRNLYAGQGATVRTHMEQQIGFKSGNE